eukprot:Rhum_TRINITY_DN15425_c6_g1::Rhum_TRINITY_DN15425_c6_g1_i4::g.157428::m.157428
MYFSFFFFAVLLRANKRKKPQGGPHHPQPDTSLSSLQLDPRHVRGTRVPGRCVLRTLRTEVVRSLVGSVLLHRDHRRHGNSIQAGQELLHLLAVLRHLRQVLRLCRVGRHVVQHRAVVERGVAHEVVGRTRHGSRRVCSIDALHAVAPRKQLQVADADACLRCPSLPSRAQRVDVVHVLRPRALLRRHSQRSPDVESVERLALRRVCPHEVCDRRQPVRHVEVLLADRSLRRRRQVVDARHETRHLRATLPDLRLVAAERVVTSDPAREEAMLVIHAGRRRCTVVTREDHYSVVETTGVLQLLHDRTHSVVHLGDVPEHRHLFRCQVRTRLVQLP